MLLENTFLKYLRGKRQISGKLAVIYDKNYMEASGYANTLATITGEPVYLVPCYKETQDITFKFKEGVLYFYIDDNWLACRAAFRYVTQKPWDRIPIHTKTLIMNPTIACLAGGRNKMMASKAYDLYNAEIETYGLKIQMPETITDVSKEEIPLWVKKFGGNAVVKDPYSNAGQGVYTITNETELNDFMQNEYAYDQFIVQSLIGNQSWSSKSGEGIFYHVGTMPNKKNQIYVADLRMMVMSTSNGYKPLALYARRASKPLAKNLVIGKSSWAMLGTNLSIKQGDNQWASDTSRLITMDRKGFNTLGIGIDDLIEAFIQTVLANIAIDKMARNLFNKNGKFRTKMFSSLDSDCKLQSEIVL